MITIREARHNKGDYDCGAYYKHYHTHNLVVWVNPGPIYRAIPRRTLRKALKYWYPKRLTLKHNDRIHAFLWWNF